MFDSKDNTQTIMSTTTGCLETPRQVEMSIKRKTYNNT